eukprot:TRINITY_DN10504_c0_g1_i1.p1 TRINITY_DN10504_c0_g1~~TRINITY_DN10504_c0_g1_i1.p1  ORF type:complete len:373 (+),score=74.95 TRINITY_DN10504_c0_g1_i1:29-1147(+)
MTEQKRKGKAVVWADGCFDMMHWGHANALRQAKSCGDYLIVGVHSDEDIKKHKGPPVMSEDERYEAVRACKWVDEVVEGAPYVTQLEWLDKHGADFCVHGDDIVTAAGGEDCYGQVKAAGRFRTVPRTEGVSTTQLVGRMLLLSREHHAPYHDDRSALTSVPTGKILDMSQGNQPNVSPYTGVSHFLPSSRRLVQFSEGREPQPTDKVVYIDGAFDLFHVGHISILKEAKKLGDYLIVGLFPDNLVNEKKGHGWPVMNIHERALGVLSCRYVDEVIIGAPWKVTEELIKSLKITYVVHGTISDPATDETKSNQEDPYDVPRKLGILKTVESPRTITTTDVVQRIIDNRQQFLERNKKKEAKELAELQTTQSS